MIYLGSPYSDPDPEVRKQRYEVTLRMTSDLVVRGFKIFAPIAYSHNLITPPHWYNDFAYWREFDFHMMDLAEQFWVLMLPGWRESKGLTAETLYWRKSRPGEYIRYMNEEGLFE